MSARATVADAGGGAAAAAVARQHAVCDGAWSRSRSRRHWRRRREPRPWRRRQRGAAGGGRTWTTCGEVEQRRWDGNGEFPALVDSGCAYRARIRPTNNHKTGPRFSPRKYWA
ncbi:Os02g0606925 [Oryza sativa Japonica Group]|uniref:Os02g0606925 protein n=1 Tax=Oryza sativa subsp. japonica TaxID=39947 RepID=A0A0P0VLQ9_ORYSJ|nr:Os02g0606925 [Oryza sativa Japonica Group]